VLLPLTLKALDKSIRQSVSCQAEIGISDRFQTAVVRLLFEPFNPDANRACRHQPFCKEGGAGRQITAAGICCFSTWQ
jgi:hypothetical protein